MCINAGNKEARRTGSIQWCPVTGAGQTLKHRRFSLNVRKHFFVVVVTDHWHMLLREGVESSSLETRILGTYQAFSKLTHSETLILTFSVSVLVVKIDGDR